MHNRILELVKKVLNENDPQRLLPSLKELRRYLAVERIRIQALVDKNAAAAKRSKQGI
jgi:hypothetical protein